MRKLFRMQYEPCTGRCYAYSDVMRIHTLGLTTQTAVQFLERLVKIHEPSCGDANIQFRLDADEWFGNPVNEFDKAERTRFVASFYHYGALDLFGGATPLEAMNKMIDAALAYYEGDDYKASVARHGGGPDHSKCEHGDDKKLIEFAIAFSGLNDAEKDALRAQFAQ